MSYNVTQKTVLNLLSAAMFQKPVFADESIDWSTVLGECRAQAVTSLAFAALPKEHVPEDVFDQWKYLFNLDVVSNSRISYAHTVLHELLTEHRIPYVILKGCISAQYYDNPVLRMMGDIDFYINPSDKKRVDSLLKSHGFELHDNDHEFETVYTKDGSIYELHTKINGIPGGKAGKQIEAYFKDIFEKAKTKNLDLAQYNSPSPFHHGLIMLLHVARHMITGGIGLRHFCDWAVFVEKMGESFPSLFESKLKKVGLWRFAQIMSQFCVLYLGATYQPWMGKLEKELLRDLKDDVFAGGNFGHKDLKRADEAKFITSRKKGGVNNDSNIKQAFLSANDIVRKHWQFADKVPVVFPVGWAFFGGRYALRALTGKRERINVNKLAKGAENRKKVYRQIKLFE